MKYTSLKYLLEQRKNLHHAQKCVVWLGPREGCLIHNMGLFSFLIHTIHSMCLNLLKYTISELVLWEHCVGFARCR